MIDVINIFPNDRKLQEQLNFLKNRIKKISLGDNVYSLQEFRKC